ncbi:hypothetical protein ACWD6I_29145 [Streptomyces sp. NPDC002454]
MSSMDVTSATSVMSATNESGRVGADTSGNVLPLPGAAAGCDLVTVPARQGLEAVDILRRDADASVGPVLHDNRCRTLGFLVPPGTAEGWDLPGSSCTRTLGRGIPTDGLADDRPAGPAAPAPPPPDPGPTAPADLVDEPPGTGWLLPPGTTGQVTDPAVLREALGRAARMIEAADNRC